MTPETIRETVRASRRAQGMPDHVTDPRFLVELAAEVIDRDAPTVELPVIGGDLDNAA